MSEDMTERKSEEISDRTSVRFIERSLLNSRRLGASTRPGASRRLGAWRLAAIRLTRQMAVSSLDPNQAKGRGGEDNSDEIWRPECSRCHQSYLLLLVLARF